MLGRKLTMHLGHYLSVLVHCTLLISAAPISSELDLAPIHIASRTAEPQALPQLAKYGQCSQALLDSR